MIAAYSVTGCHILSDLSLQHPHGGHHRRPTLLHDAQRPDGLAQASEDLVLLLRALKVLITNRNL